MNRGRDGNGRFFDQPRRLDEVTPVADADPIVAIARILGADVKTSKDLTDPCQIRFKETVDLRDIQQRM